MWLFALFVAIPLIEIALFIQIGGLIGLWWTLAIVVLTALAGTYLVRSQGRDVLRQVQTAFDDLHDPTEPLAHGAMILFAGALMLTPGFFTDAVGFSLLLPPVRRTVFKTLRKRVRVQGFAARRTADPQRSGPRSGVIDGEFEEVRTRDPGADGSEVEFSDNAKRPTPPPSGWTKH